MRRNSASSASSQGHHGAEDSHATGAWSLAEPGALPAPPPRAGRQPVGKLSVVVPPVAVGGSRKGKEKEDENITVGVRIRPPGPGDGSSPVFLARGERSVAALTADGKPAKEYTFDYVFGPEAPTDKVFESLARPIVDKTLSGYNGTVFAFGQTASGKTHTLMGRPECPGLTWLAVDEIFSRIRDQMLDTEFLIRMSYIEIYNEEIKDLLNAKSTEKLRVVDDKTGPAIRGLKEETVTSKEQLLELIELGESNRHYGETLMNAKSSRSHVLFRLVIESRQVLQGEQPSGVPSPRVSWGCQKPVRSSQLYLVDLAGSERARTGGGADAEAELLSLREGNAINRSLLTLGTVIHRLAEGGKEHIPYRDSVLTRLLSTSLGGNAKTAMLATVHCSAAHRDKTLNTLRYARRVKLIKTSAQVNEITDASSVLASMRSEIERLRRQLEERDAMARMASAADEELQQLQEERDADRQKLQQLTKLILGAKVVERAAKDGSGNEVISRERARQIGRDLTSVALGRRRVESVLARHSSVFDQLPDEAKRILSRTNSHEGSASRVTELQQGEEGADSMQTRGGEDVQDDDDDDDDDEDDDMIDPLFDHASGSSADVLRQEVAQLREQLQGAKAKGLVAEEEARTERLRRQQTEEELERLKGQLSSSEGELDELYEEKVQLLMKIEQLNGLVKQQQQQPPGHQRSSSRELLQIVDKLKADKQRLESELQQSREDSETSARASDEQRKDMKLWLQALQRSDEAKEREIAMLKAKLESRSKELKRLLSDAGKDKEGEEGGDPMDIHRLRARVSELQQALAVAKEQIRALALEAEAEKQDAVAVEQAAKAELESTIASLRQELSEREASLVQVTGELEEEAVRAAALAKDKARLLVDGQMLARKHEAQGKELLKVEDNLRSARQKLQEATKQGQSWGAELQVTKDSQAVLGRRLESLQQQLSFAEGGRAMAQKELDSMQEDLADAIKERDSMRSRAAQAEKELDGVRQERQSLEDGLKQMEQQLAAARAQLEVEEDRAIKANNELERTGAAALEIHRLGELLVSVQDDADRALRRCAELDRLLAAETAKLDDSRARQKKLEADCATHRQRAETFAQENNTLKEQLRREQSSSKLRHEVAASAEEKAEAAVATKRALESQLEELTASYVQALNDKRVIEEENIGLQAELSLAKDETEAYRTQAGRSRDAMLQAEKAERLTDEVEGLRRQLAGMRVTMLEYHQQQGGGPEGREGGGTGERAAVEQLRLKRMYEGIVNSLRAELAEECELRKKMQDQIKALRGSSEKSKELLEEVEFMSIRAKRAQEDSQAASSVAAQSKREEQLVRQERDAAAREALRLKELCQNQEKEIDHLQAGLDRERRRADRLAEECSRYEKRAAQGVSAANRAEAELETLRQEAQRQQVDVQLHAQSAGASSEKLSQLQHDFLALVNAHDALQAEADGLRLKVEELERTARQQASVEAARRREVKTSQAVKFEHEQHVLVLKKALQEKDLEVKSMQEQLGRSREALERTRIEAMQIGSAKASEQLQDLRLELDHTLSEWGKAERARKAREENVARLKSSLQGQVEKNMLVQTQVKLLEEQVRSLTEEVGVYRQLEVYNTTLQHEFRNLRERRRKREGARSKSASKFSRVSSNYASDKACHRERLIDLACWGDESPSPSKRTRDVHETVLQGFASPPRRVPSAFSSPSASPTRSRPPAQSGSYCWPPSSSAERARDPGSLR